MQLDNIVSGTTHYPRFIDGRIDYTHAKHCYGVTCIVICNNRILLTQRSKDVMAHAGKYSGISGFIDRTDCSIIDIARIELEEELRAPLTDIVVCDVGNPVIVDDSSTGRVWHDYPVLVEFTHEFTPIINWENTSAQWYDLDDIDHLPFVPQFNRTLRAALALRDYQSSPENKNSKAIYTTQTLASSSAS